MNWTELRQQHLGELATSKLPVKVELPPLPHVVSQVCQRANDPHCTAQDLAILLEKDVALTCDILKHVNSAANGLRNKSSTARKALTMLGVAKTRLFLVTTVLEQNMQKSKSPILHTRRFCETALERALLAKEIAGRLKQDTDLAFAAALLQDFVVPAVSVAKLTDYRQFVSQLATSGENLNQLEQKAFGWSHADCAARLMLSWGFPDDLICCVLLHHQSDEIWGNDQLKNTPLVAVALSSLLPSHLEPSTTTISKLASLTRDRLGLELTSLAEAVHQQLETQNVDFHEYQTLHMTIQQSPGLLLSTDTLCTSELVDVAASIAAVQRVTSTDREFVETF
jgi:HD-like signal output (HDOD) protein